MRTPSTASHLQLEERPMMSGASGDAAQRRKEHIRDQQQASRREKGLLSCAECYRLKMKCDKRVPCTPCLAKGCADICPNGIRTPARSGLGAQSLSERLNQKIALLTHRVRELEDALAHLQSTVSRDPHPLLLHRLAPLDEGQKQETKSSSSNENAATPVDDAFKDLVIDERGEAYFGPTGNDEILIHREVGSASPSPESKPSSDILLFDAIKAISGIFPFLPGGSWHSREPIVALLNLFPAHHRALALCDAFYERVVFGSRIIARDEVMDSLIGPVYGYIHRRQKDPLSTEMLPLNPHQIGVIFSVFALGSLADISSPTRFKEAENYFILSRCAMALISVFDSPGVSTVQILILSASYHLAAPAGEKYNLDSSWRLVATACGIARSIGLHRDPAKWGFPPPEIQRRRTLFWEVFVADGFHALATGRPPNLSLRYVDCQFPEAIPNAKVATTKGVPEVSILRYRFASEITASVIQMTLQVATPSYEEVLRLHKKAHAVPVSPLDDKIIGDSPFPPMPYMNSMYAHMYRNTVSIYLHRGFFAKAIQENPNDPGQSKYAESFHAATHAALDLVRLTKKTFEYFPAMGRQWMELFAQLFYAATILGSLVFRSPSSPLAGIALHELKDIMKIALDVFTDFRNGRHSMELLQRLLRSANQAYESYHAPRAQDQGQTVAASSASTVPSHPVVTSNAHSRELPRDSVDYSQAGHRRSVTTAAAESSQHHPQAYATQHQHHPPSVPGVPSIPDPTIQNPQIDTCAPAAAVVANTSYAHLVPTIAASASREAYASVPYHNVPQDVPTQPSHLLSSQQYPPASQQQQLATITTAWSGQSQWPTAEGAGSAGGREDQNRQVQDPYHLHHLQQHPHAYAYHGQASSDPHGIVPNQPSGMTTRTEAINSQNIVNGQWMLFMHESGLLPMSAVEDTSGLFLGEAGSYGDGYGYDYSYGDRVGDIAGTSTGVGEGSYDPGHNRIGVEAEAYPHRHPYTHQYPEQDPLLGSLYI